MRAVLPDLGRRACVGPVVGLAVPWRSPGAAETKTAETKTAETKTAETKTAETKTAETKTAETAETETRLCTSAHSGSATDPEAGLIA